jgi:Collagen triple helix repeat (20 copies)
MRNIWTVLALTMVVGCGGGDGKDGADGAQGTAGPAGVNGKDGADGDDGAPGTTGKDGANGTDGTNGTNGTDGTDGGAILKGTGAPAASLGADGDLYIDTVSRDVYQKSGGTWSVITNLSGGPPGPKGDTGAKGDPGTNGTDGTNGTSGSNGSSVRSGAGAPAAGLGALGDVYIDSTTGDLYAKGAGGWAKTGNLAGPPGTDGTDGQDATDTLKGVRWFAFALTSAFVNAPQLITNETYTATTSAATFAFTAVNQHGRLAFQTAGSFVPGGVDLSAFEALDFSATVTGGAVNNIVVFLTEGDKKFCQWEFTTATGPSYSVDLTDLSNCFPLTGPQFSLASVTQIEVGIVSNNVPGPRTLTINDINLVDSL